MALKKINPTTTSAWSKLEAHFKEINNVTLKDWFDRDDQRAKNFTITWQDFYIDFSKNRLNQQTLNLFKELAEEVDLKDAISKYFSGVKINETETRAVLHTALRMPNDSKVLVDGKNIIPEISAVKNQMKSFSEDVINGQKKGFTDKQFTDIVNVGIGGSDLGPAMVVEALQFYKNHLTTHFVSNVDGDHVHEILKKLNPETTLFVIVSKTFTTQETLSNANTIRDWFLERGANEDIKNHFVAVSTNIEKVKLFGITTENIFPMWNWVGGRFSLWSAVGLSISLSLGYQNFENLLLGAQKTDVHFKDEPFLSNIPVILAFISIWYNNFYNAESEAVIPYSQYLSKFAAYLQQASMESNGKRIDRSGNPVNYQTGNIIWGEPGTNSQHAFFQLIHQGTKLIPCDFIGFVNPLHNNTNHHNKLISNFIAQTKALMHGLSKNEIPIENLENIPFKEFQGNKPTNTIFIDKLTPESLGKLLAMYEHKTFVQGILWNIYSYDQFGVELGKQMAGSILKEFKADHRSTHDSSSQALIDHFKA